MLELLAMRLATRLSQRTTVARPLSSGSPPKQSEVDRMPPGVSLRLLRTSCAGMKKPASDLAILPSQKRAFVRSGDRI